MIWATERIRSVVALAAHPDDIEIGAGGTIALLAALLPHAAFTFVCATGADAIRADEASASARHLLGDRVTLHLGEWQDTMLPYADPASTKRWVARSVRGLEPNLVFAPHLHDRHQDHRFVAEVAWQLFRRSDILEYEIPKWEGDRPAANLYVPLDEEMAEGKLDHLARHFESQHDKPWYDRELFRSVLRLRGMEAGTELAEAFVARKMVWSPGRH